MSIASYLKRRARRRHLLKIRYNYPIKQWEKWLVAVTSEQKPLIRDHIQELRKCLVRYHEIEQAYITTRESCETELENYSDSYMWLSLPMPDEQPETVSDMILSGVEDLPNTCLAGILASILKNRVPNGIQMNGMSIDRVGSSFRFCISGSASLEDLQTLCAQYELSRGFEAEK